MITAGEQTAKPGEWAAALTTGLLLPVYRHALEYIDDRGWFNNTFDSPDDLEGEVQRVLDLRYEFGVVDDWPEFPFPDGWKPYYLERRRRERRRAFTAELLKKVVANEKKYRTDAITYLQETAGEPGVRNKPSASCGTRMENAGRLRPAGPPRTCRRFAPSAVCLPRRKRCAPRSCS